MPESPASLQKIVFIYAEEETIESIHVQYFVDSSLPYNSQFYHYHY